MQNSRAIIVALVATMLSVPAIAQFNETGGGHAIIGYGANDTTYYSPSFVYGENNCGKPDTQGQTITGQCVYLYVQADDDLNNPPLDQVRLYWNPNTWPGLTTRFAGSDQLLPSTDYLGNNHSTTHHFGGPSAFGFNGKYYMTAVESATAADFRIYWWGVSENGQTWTWYPFLTHQSGTLEIPAMSLQPTYFNSQWYFYGFMEVTGGYGTGIGAIRVRSNTSRARGYDQVEMYTSGSGWVVVANDANPNGYTSVIPAKLLDSRVQPKYLENGELWMSVVNQNRNCNNCYFEGSTPKNGWIDRFAYRSVTVTSGAPTFGTEATLTSSVRCMPGNYDNSRVTAQPLASGSPRLLYSATNDADWGSGYCYATGPNTFPGMYIVVTSFQ